MSKYLCVENLYLKNSFQKQSVGLGNHLKVYGKIEILEQGKLNIFRNK